jgi:hypothetical protein
VDDPADGVAAWEDAQASASPAEREKLPAIVRRALAVDRADRKPNQQEALKKHFLTVHPTARKIQAQIDKLQHKLDELAPPQSLVMTEMPAPRKTHIFERGSFLAPGETVEPLTPRILPPMPASAPRNRLGLAEWLVDPANPLVARVQVNRAWAELFGRGLVASEEDLGTQSAPPTHPQLLDWLALELTRRDWSLKHLHRVIVTSATYRQSSDFRPDLARRDPYNLLLARGPRFRLRAELIRDYALAVSGLLSSKMLGPPVHPPQPEGIWRVTGAVDNTYRVSPGEDALRRGVYTVWRRSAPYPSFTNFDAPDRLACTIKRSQSNTPLQALTLLNDPVYIDLAKALADRIVRETAGDPRPRQLAYAFRLVLTRHPQPKELAQLEQIFCQALARYASDDRAARQVRGEHPLPEQTDNAQWAAWFNLAHVLLNLDETINKN